MTLIDMQTHVADELKRRGLQTYVGVERLADGIECYMVSLPNDEDDDD